MAFTSISSTLINVGKAVKRELWLLTKNNFDDHEERISGLETAGSLIEVFDQTVYNASVAATLTGVLFFQAKQSMRITKVQVQIFTKGSISSGSVEIDLKKSSSLGGSYSSIMTTKPILNFATASDYDSDDGTINASLASLDVDDFVRLDFTTLPTVPLQKCRVVVYGEIDS